MNRVRLGLVVMLNFFAVVTLPVAWSQTSSPPPFITELGFKRLSHPTTPAFLKQASASVFEVRSLAEEKVEDLTTIDLTDPKMADIESKIDGISEFDEKEKLIFKRQIQNCHKKGLQKECTIFFAIESGTAFLAGNDGSKLWTNAHLVSRFIKFRASLDKQPIPELLKKDGRVAIFLFDHEGNLVFDPFEDRASVTDFGEASFLSLIRGEWYAEDTDFVGIELSRRIGNPLKIGKAPEPGQLLFRPGFSSCTGCTLNPNQIDPLLNNDRGAGKNSDGRGMYWTSGRSQPIEAVNSFLGTQSIQSLFRIDQMIMFSADSQVGFSGGPILNESGEVVGIFAGSKPRIYLNNMVVLSRGVRPPIFNQLK